MTTVSSSPPSLLDTPPEVLFSILANLDPIDVAAISQTCKSLYLYTKSDNALLWKTLFIKMFDVPDANQMQIDDHCTCVKDRCRARGIIRTPHRQKQELQREFVLRTLYSIFITTPRSLPFSASKNATCLESLLSSKSAIKDWLSVSPPWQVLPTSTNPTHHLALDELSSLLHLAGMSMREVSWLSYKAGQVYREEVYRSSNFEEENFYGPLKKGTAGKMVVDWRMLDAVSITMSLNVRSAWHQWGEEAEQDMLPYGYSHSMFWKTPSSSSKDWACVTGRWSYIYAFIDFNDYFAYNFAPGSETNSGNDLSGISEAVGGINTLELALLPDEEQDWDTTGAHELYPPLKFQGESTGPSGSTFRGVVKMLDSGFQHWEFTIRYSGSDRWQTSGVEVGGRGIYGIWTDVLHEDLSPCGPVWYFRA